MNLFRSCLGESKEALSLISKLIPLKLEQLMLNGNSLSADSSAHLLGQLTTLRSLDLSNNFFNQKNASALNNLTNLKTLKLSFNHIGTGQINYISNITSITDLDLSFNCLLLNDISIICNLTNLRSLNLKSNGFFVNEQIFNYFNKLENLTYLNLENNKSSWIKQETIYFLILSHLKIEKITLDI